MRRSGTAAVSRSSLLDGLLAHYRLDDAGTYRQDSVGGPALNVYGGPAIVEGHCQSGATQFVSGFSQYLILETDSLLRLNYTPFTIACWCALDSLGAAGVVGRWGPGSLGYQLFFDGTNFGGQLSNDGVTPVPAVDLTEVETATWYHLLMQYDDDSGTLGFQLNNGSPVEVEFAGPVNGVSDYLKFGKDAALSNDLSGRIESVSFWGRLLSESEKASLYNGGAGRAYPFS